MKLQLAGQEQVGAPVRPGCRQRVLQQRQQGIRRQALAEQRRHLPQQPAGRRQGQRLARRSSGRMPQRSSAAVTRRVRIAVRRDQRRDRPCSAAWRRISAIAEASARVPAPRSGSLACGRAQIGQVRPSVSH